MAEEAPIKLKIDWDSKDAEHSISKLSQKFVDAFKEGKTNPLEQLDKDIQKTYDNIDQLSKKIKATQAEIQKQIGEAGFKGDVFTTPDISNVQKRFDEISNELDKYEAKKQLTAAEKEYVSELREEMRNLGKILDLNDIMNKDIQSKEQQKEQVKILNNQYDKLNEKTEQYSQTSKKTFGGMGLKQLILYSLGIRSIYTLVGKLKSKLTEGFKYLGNYSKEFKNTMNQLKGDSKAIAAGLAAAFAPLITSLAPVLTWLTQKFVQLCNLVADFNAALTGAKTVKHATTDMKKYAKAVADADKANKGALASFDDINVLQQDNGDEGKDFFEEGGVGAGTIEESLPENAFTKVGQWIHDHMIVPLQEFWKTLTGMELSDGAAILITLGLIALVVWGLVKAVGALLNPQKKLNDLAKKGLGILDKAVTLAGIIGILWALSEVIDSITGLMKELNESDREWWQDLVLMVAPILAVAAAVAIMVTAIRGIDALNLAALALVLWALSAPLQAIADILEAVAGSTMGELGMQMGIIVVALGSIAGFLALMIPIMAALTPFLIPLVAIMAALALTLPPILQAIADFTVQVLPALSDFISVVLPVALDFLNGICDILQRLVNIVKQVWSTVKTIIEDVIKLVEFLVDTILSCVEKIVGGIIQGITDFVNFAVQAIAFLINNTIIAGINAILDAGAWLLELVGVDIKTSHISNWNPEPFIPNLPKINYHGLATGAVLPPNQPFLAMVGDQKSGTNIEAPLDTIVAAMEQALASQSGGYGNQPIVLNIDGQEFARLTVPSSLKEMKRSGYNVSLIGVK